MVLIFINLLVSIVRNGLLIDSCTRCPDARVEGEAQQHGFN